ncbi:hypothetical protein [Parvibaculum sp.]|uniref:hypothetical protein n=1 Tax=Parvibaculum sp. TaxID=2024848 RepID=UPI00391AE9E8
MNILATYATSYVGAFDVALSARRGEIREANGEISQKAADKRGASLLAKVFSLGATKRAA